MSALLYGFFACYAVTGKCDLRIDKEGHDVPVFASLDECQRFGGEAAKQAPDKQGKWKLDESHYYQCFGLTPVPAPVAAPPPRPVYTTTAEALQRDFQTNADALTQKIGGAVIEVSGIVDNAGIADGTAIQLSGDSWDVTAWFSSEGGGAAGILKREHVTLRCDRIGTLVAAAGRRPGIVELRDCNVAQAGK